MPYFPLVAYCQRYVRNAGIGTVDLDDAALQPRVHHDLDDLPLLFWAAGLPLGIQGAYTYPETNGPGGDRCSTSPR
jgi:aminobenzoyl-glutamate transport protein